MIILINIYMAINKKLFNCIIKHAKLSCPNLRKPKYTHEYYLTNILDVLTDFVKWSSLQKSKNLESAYEYHYKTIAKIHKKWCDKNVYVNAHNELVKSKNLTENDDGIIVLLIDSTLIINKTGVDKIGYGGPCKKKKFTKLSLMSNLEGENVAVRMDNINVKDKKDYPFKRNIKINTLNHDIKAIEPLIKDIRKTTNKPIEVYGDKGYVISEDDKKRIKKSLNAKIIYTKRSNQKVKNTKKEKKILRKRYKIENMNADFKTYNRVHVRRDISEKTYLGFVYLALIIKFGKI